MTIGQLLVQLQSLGVRLAVRGDRLAYYPKSAVPTELTEALRRHKPQLLKMLSPAAPPRIDIHDAQAVWSAAVDQLVDDPEWPPDLIEALRSAVPRWSDDPGATPASVATLPKQAQDGEELTEIEWHEPCKQCGSLGLWETVGGSWRCLHCDPPTASRRFRALAQQIRRRSSMRTNRHMLRR